MRKIAVVILLAWIIPIAASAEDFIYIHDMSQLKWQAHSEVPLVWFRNLHEFDASFLGCCYNYWMDISTPAGKAVWAVILMKMNNAQPFYLSVSNKNQPGSIQYVGSW
jgi:hypothetical protein